MITKEEIKSILDLHAKWLKGEVGGVRADLSRASLYCANLSGADISRANLSDANLSDANLSDANLSYANLSRANLYCANLSRANLSGANLSGADISRANLFSANLSRANLSGANLSGADLFSANLSRANLSGANLSGAKLPKFQITPKGFPLYGFKKLQGEKIVTLLIPAEAERTATPVGRKCRAEYVVVVDGEGISKHDSKTTYEVGKTVYPDKYDPDIRAECTNGIHFFLTREEAEEY